MAAIVADGLTKRFGTVTAVEDFTLTVERGEVFGFLGPNGAGKSTTIDMLLDYVRPTAGQVSILGIDPQQNPRAVRQRVGILPENYDLYDRLTAREHLELVADMQGVETDVEALADRVGLATDADRAVSGYSKGMRQRLALGMALVGDPEILILDEPSSGLDPNGARELREIVREQAEQGVTVFFSSHVLEQVEAVCDRVGILADGHLRAVETVEAIRDDHSTLVLSVDSVPDEHGLADVEGVAGATTETGRIEVECEPGAKSAVIDRVEQAGATVLDIDSEKQSLEDVFAAYTDGGRR